MYEMEAQFGFTPGKAVARVKASDLRALWKLGRDSETHAMAHNPEFKRGHLAIGADLAKRVCSPEADVNDGKIKLQGEHWLISRALSGERIRLVTMEQRVLVYYCQSLVRELDLGNQRSTIVDRWLPDESSPTKL